MDLLAEVLSTPERPRTQRTITCRRAALRHDIEVVGTSRARPPRDYSWRSGLILLIANILAIALAMRAEGYFDWW